MVAYADVLSRVASDLRGAGQPFALVGALAVAVRAEERHTKDIDFAVAVPDEQAALLVLRHLVGTKNYELVKRWGPPDSEALSGVALRPPGHVGDVVLVDLLFSTCGVEREVVSRAETIEVLPGVQMRVATLGDLLAMKTLSLDDARRPRDRGDIAGLLRVATVADVDVAKDALSRMQERGFGWNVGKDELLTELEEHCALYAPHLVRDEKLRGEAERAATPAPQIDLEEDLEPER